MQYQFGDTGAFVVDHYPFSATGFLYVFGVNIFNGAATAAVGNVVLTIFRQII